MKRKIIGITPNRIDEDGIPVLTVEAYKYRPAERNCGASFYVAAYCEQCRDWHHHAIPAGDPPKGLTHRAAHCHVPAAPGAYFIDYDFTAPPVNPKAL